MDRRPMVPRRSGVSVLPPTRAIAAHEAAHAASLCISKMTPAVVRVDFPRAGGRTYAGKTTIDWDAHDPTDPAVMSDLLVAVLMGPLTEGVRVEDWPVDPSAWPDECQGDAEQALFIARWLDVRDQIDWLKFACRAGGRYRTFSYRRLAVAIAGELERVEVLFKPELVAITERTLMGS